MKSCGERLAKSPSNGITTSSRTPSPAIRSALVSSEVISFGAVSGETTVRGCGSNVSTVSAPRITSRWPRCTPSNSPTATWRGRGLGIGEPGDLHQPRKPTTGLSVPSPRGSASAIRPSPSSSRTVRRGRAGRDRHAVAGAPGVLAGQLDGRQEAERVGERRRSARRRRRRTARSGAPQLEAVRVAEVGDQRAHVGARAALDRERRPLAVAPEQLEARARRPRARGARPPRRRAPARTRAGRRPAPPSRPAAAGGSARSAARAARTACGRARSRRRRRRWST